MRDGFTVISNGMLKNHPIFKDYLESRKLLKGGIYQRFPVLEGPSDPEYEHSVWEYAKTNDIILFALPGQPEFRTLLGGYVQPTRIFFKNFTFYAEKSPLEKYLRAYRGENVDLLEDYKMITDDLDKRLVRFRNAEFTVSRGLPPNHFESN